MRFIVANTRRSFRLITEYGTTPLYRDGTGKMAVVLNVYKMKCSKVCSRYNHKLFQPYLSLPRAYVVGLSNWFCLVSSVCHTKNWKLFQTRNLACLTTSKHSFNDDSRRVLLYMCLIGAKAFLFSRFPALSYCRCRPPFNTAMVTLTQSRCSLPSSFEAELIAEKSGCRHCRHSL